MKLPEKTMETNQNHGTTLINHGNQTKTIKTMKLLKNNMETNQKTMKNHETTLKNHGNQPITMNNHETTLKNQKPTKNHQKP